MRSNIASFRELMELWPTVSAFAEAIDAPQPTANKWRQRDRIPADWWAAVLKTQEAKESRVTADLLVTLAARERQW